MEIWGVVEGGHDMDRLNNSVCLSSVGTFMGLLWDQATLDRLLLTWQEKGPDLEAPIKYCISPFADR